MSSCDIAGLAIWQRAALLFPSLEHILEAGSISFATGAVLSALAAVVAAHLIFKEYVRSSLSPLEGEDRKLEKIASSSPPFPDFRSPSEGLYGMFLDDDPQPMVYPSREFRERFEMDGLCGRGGFADVWLCTEKDSGVQYACKVLERRACPKLTSRDVDILKESGHREEGAGSAYSREVAIMRHLSGQHEGLVKMKEALETTSKVHIAMELCEGGDLFELIDECGPMPEPAAKGLFRQLVSAVSFCNSKLVLHRDLKPENVFLDQPADMIYMHPERASRVKVKLADFGLAVLLRPGEAVRGAAGSELYAPPEMMNRKPYAMQADSWSLGLILYVMLTGSLPGAIPSEEEGEATGRRRQKELTLKGARHDTASLASSSSSVEEQPRDLRQYCGGRHPVWDRPSGEPIDLESMPGWESFSDSAQDLLSQLLEADPSLRPGASEVLSHPWLALCCEAEAEKEAHRLLFHPPTPLSGSCSGEDSRDVRAEGRRWFARDE